MRNLNIGLALMLLVSSSMLLEIHSFPFFNRLFGKNKTEEKRPMATNSKRSNISHRMWHYNFNKTIHHKNESNHSTMNNFLRGFELDERNDWLTRMRHGFMEDSGLMSRNPFGPLFP
jgi:hypothetical protein